jgi:hypothetical protein
MSPKVTRGAVAIGWAAVFLSSPDAQGPPSPIQNGLTIAQIADIIVKILAIAIGGWWTYKAFIQKRQKYPRAAVSHELAAWPLGTEGFVLHISLKIQNTGDVLIQVRGGSLRVYALDRHNTSWLLLPHMPMIPPDAKPEFKWRRLGKHLLPQDCEIEPGETDYFPYEVYIPNRSTKVKIYSHVSNATKHNKRIGWNRTTIHNLKPLLLSTTKLAKTKEKES